MNEGSTSTFATTSERPAYALPFVRDCWYVAAWSHDIAPGALFTRRLLGEAVVFFRRDGAIVALADRCAHRAAPLSRGRLEDGGLRCMYHGLKFAPDGHCTEVPGQATVPPRMHVRAYPVVERNTWVWIWMGDPALADPASIPHAFSLDHPAWRSKPGYLRYEANHMLIIDNLLDFSHLTFVHPSTLGGSEAIAEVRPEIESIECGLRVTRWVLDDVPAPFHARVGRFDGRVDRWYLYDFLAPGVLLMDSGVQRTGTGAPEGRRSPDALQFRSCQAVTPETDRTSHYFYAVPHNFALDDRSVTESIFDSVVTAFEEDRQIIEAQQHVLDTERDIVMRPIAADAALSRFRLLIEKMGQAEAQRAARTPTVIPILPNIPEETT